jgi:D-3-phosphoglycerate dehydrogenase / 2-oxoglutarate reductase
MRILFADPFPATHVTDLEQRGARCRVEPELSADDLRRSLGEAEILVVRSTRVPAATIAVARSLRLIIRAGSGVDTIDIAAANATGVQVCNVPGRNAVAVAELTLGLLIAVDRRIADATADLRLGYWDKRSHSAGGGLAGRVLGIVGMGAIGLAVAERASAFGMRLRTLARPRPPEVAERVAALGVHPVRDLEALAEECDAVTFHIPATPETRGIIGETLLSRMRPGAIVINTARGELVDPAALVEAMDTRGIRAGLDVFPDEPGRGRGRWDSPLARHPNVTATPHIGASTLQAQEAIADEVVAIVAAFQRGEVRNGVNLPHPQAGDVPTRTGSAGSHLRAAPAAAADPA